MHLCAYSTCISSVGQLPQYLCFCFQNLHDFQVGERLTDRLLLVALKRLVLSHCVLSLRLTRLTRAHWSRCCFFLFFFTGTIAGDAFYIHDHFSASTQVIYSLAAVILASWEIILNDLASTSLQPCWTPRFRFTALCASDESKFS